MNGQYLIMTKIIVTDGSHKKTVEYIKELISNEINVIIMHQHVTFYLPELTHGNLAIIVQMFSA